MTCPRSASLSRTPACCRLAQPSLDSCPGARGAGAGACGLSGLLRAQFMTPGKPHRHCSGRTPFSQSQGNSERRACSISIARWSAAARKPALEIAPCRIEWGEYPIPTRDGTAYDNWMPHQKFLPDQSQKPGGSFRTAAAAELTQSEIDFVPSRDEVARKAYFSYLNQGSLQGHEVQHWLDAEAHLVEERRLTRTHGFHHKT